MVKKIIRNFHTHLREGAKLNIFVDALINELDEVVVTFDDVKEAIQISTATGSFLDDIGRLFSLTRDSGETDAQFRARILAFWPGFSGSGTIDDLKNVVNRITGIDVDDIDITEIEAAKFLIAFNIGPNFELIDTVKSLVFQNKAAGTYPFFQIDTGFRDDVTWSDNVTLTDLDNIIISEYDFNDNSLF